MQFKIVITQKCVTICVMSGTLTVRLDDRTEAELARLLADGVGPNRNAIVRDAIHQATRNHIEQRLREQSAAIMNDPTERKLGEELYEDMDNLRAW
ncbi:MAG: hypothetical protein DLM55_01870 [Acidimicrobiales bacterium]|nr:MAG: hypothetical protein DLM55_01870 [Acidimicrobiales bacterium]